MQKSVAYSLLDIKAFDDDKREIRGTATTPEPDRMGDIVDPLGAKFAASIPLLWQHQHGSPIGEAMLSKPTKNGIDFVARLAKIDEPGPLKDMVDMAWQAIKARLVKGVSIGFSADKYDYMNEGGIRYNEYEIIELSAVTIPANASATIQSIKSFANRSDSVTLIRSENKGAVKLCRAKDHVRLN